MVSRLFGNQLLSRLQAFPAVTILGPRQCGKTTLAKEILPGWTYVDCEKPSDRRPFEEDAEAYLASLGDRVVLDEAQQLPEIFPLLRGVIDEERGRNSRFVLLGSASPRLVKGVSESLAGRTAFVDLAPLLFCETAKHDPLLPMERLWYRGGFPNAFLWEDEQSLPVWFESYVRTFIERDLNLWGVECSSTTMNKLWTMLSHTNAGMWNASQIASSLGVNYQTVNRYVDILEQAFLIRRLPPYFANIGKRLVKSPKIFFRDCGLLHHFLGIHSSETLATHPARGASFEAFALEQLTGLFSLKSPGSRFYYWRTAGGAEVDLLVETQGRLIPFEIKLNSSPSRQIVQGLLACMRDLGIPKGYVVCPCKKAYSLGMNVFALPAGECLRSLACLDL